MEELLIVWDELTGPFKKVNKCLNMKQANFAVFFKSLPGIAYKDLLFSWLPRNVTDSVCALWDNRKLKICEERLKKFIFSHYVKQSSDKAATMEPKDTVYYK